MIKVTKEQWDNIPKDYKGKWSDLIIRIHGMDEEWIGKRNVMSQCVGGNNGTALLTEGVHFEIVE